MIPGTVVVFPISKTLTGIGMALRIEGDTVVITRRGKTYRRALKDVQPSNGKAAR